MILPRYASAAEVTSPDGKYVATVTDAHEYSMGSETYGTLTITGDYRGFPMHFVFEDCNPNVLWSDDSKMLAVPQRTREQGLRLALISLPRGQTHCIPRLFVELELHSFDGAIIRGIDGPDCFPMRFEIDVSRAFHSLDAGVR
jgi:hypothetical protein